MRETNVKSNTKRTSFFWSPASNYCVMLASWPLTVASRSCSNDVAFYIDWRLILYIMPRIATLALHPLFVLDELFRLRQLDKLCTDGGHLDVSKDGAKRFVQAGDTWLYQRCETIDLSLDSLVDGEDQWSECIVPFSVIKIEAVECMPKGADIASQYFL